MSNSINANSPSISRLSEALGLLDRDKIILENVRLATDKIDAALHSAVTQKGYFLGIFPYRKNRLVYALADELLRPDAPRQVKRQFCSIYAGSFNEARRHILKGNLQAASQCFSNGFDRIKAFAISNPKLSNYTEDITDNAGFQDLDNPYNSKNNILKTSVENVKTWFVATIQTPFGFITEAKLDLKEVYAAAQKSGYPDRGFLPNGILELYRQARENIAYGRHGLNAASLKLGAIGALVIAAFSLWNTQKSDTQA